MNMGRVIGNEKKKKMSSRIITRPPCKFMKSTFSLYNNYATASCLKQSIRSRVIRISRALNIGADHDMVKPNRRALKHTL